MRRTPVEVVVEVEAGVPTPSVRVEPLEGREIVDGRVGVAIGPGPPTEDRLRMLAPSFDLTRAVSDRLAEDTLLGFL